MKLDEWLRKELETRGWSIAEFARRSGISKGTISRVLNGQAEAGEDFCAKTAAALALPPARVFRLAGLIPSYPIPDVWVQQTMEALYTLTPEQRDVFTWLIELAMLSNSLQKGKGNR